MLSEEFLESLKIGKALSTANINSKLQLEPEVTSKDVELILEAFKNSFNRKIFLLRIEDFEYTESVKNSLKSNFLSTMKSYESKLSSRLNKAISANYY